MLQKFREYSQGLIAWFIVLLIAAAFAFFGLSDHFAANMKGSVAAEVDGQKISWREVENYAERLSQQHRGEINREELLQQSIATVIKRVALIKDAHELGFRVGEQQVAQVLSQIPVFQVDGKFSKKHYLELLKQASYSDAEFRHQLSQDILLGQLERGLNSSNYLSENELQEIVGVLDQKRNFGYVVIPNNKFKKEIKVSAEDIQKYYETNKTKFIKPEEVVLEYVELSLEPMLASIQPAEDEIAAYYKQHESAYSMPNRVHARHILITAPEGDSALDLKAKEKIEAIAKQIKEGAEFETLAKQESQDPGSAEKGGDLGWFAQGQMVPEFEKAAFALKNKDEISNIIRTPFGYHIIQLVERKDAELRPFDQVKSLIEEQIKREKAQIVFAEKAEKMAKLAFEQGTNLAQLAEQFDLKVQNTPAISRKDGKVIPNRDAVASNPDVIKVAFDEEILKGRNSEPVRLTDSSMAIFHLKSHQAAVQETLEQAKKEVETLMIAEKAKEASQALGEKIILGIRDGENPSDLAKKENLSWSIKSDISRSSREVPHEIISYAYQIAPKQEKSKESGIRGFVLSSGDYLVLSLNKVIPGEWSKLDAEAQKSYREGLTNYSNQLEYLLYVEEVLANTKVRMSKPPTVR